MTHPMTAGGLSGGSIAGLVIGLVIALLLLVAIVILAVFLYDRYKYQSEIGPPPSRKGSMRLVGLGACREEGAMLAWGVSEGGERREGGRDPCDW